MKHYLLDTNTVSHLIRQHPAVVGRVTSVSMTSLCTSVVTQGELLYGLARRPEAKKLHQAVHEFLLRVEVFPWDSETSGTYGVMRAGMEKKGKTLAPLDMMIAAHALAINATLVTSDGAFKHVPGLRTEDWSK